MLLCPRIKVAGTQGPEEYLEKESSFTCSCGHRSGWKLRNTDLSSRIGVGGSGEETERE